MIGTSFGFHHRRFSNLSHSSASSCYAATVVLCLHVANRRQWHWSKQSPIGTRSDERLNGLNSPFIYKHLDVSAMSTPTCWGRLSFTWWLSLSVSDDPHTIGSDFWNTLLFTGLGGKKQQQLLAKDRTDRPRVLTAMFLSHFIPLKRSMCWFFNCKSVTSVGQLLTWWHHHYKLLACHWLVVVLSWQLPSAQWRSDRQNSIGLVM